MNASGLNNAKNSKLCVLHSYHIVEILVLPTSLMLNYNKLGLFL